MNSARRDLIQALLQVIAEHQQALFHLQRAEDISQRVSRIPDSAVVTGIAIGRSTRGRKSMGPEERLQISDRMRKYWAKRREAGR